MSCGTTSHSGTSVRSGGGVQRLDRQRVLVGGFSYGAL
jgi:predicted dienelactone hydrolase